MQMQKEKRSATTKILAKLLEGGPIPVSQLANDLHMTEKQVRTRLEQVEDLLFYQGWGSIRKKPRIGIWLEADDLERAQIRDYVCASQSEIMTIDDRESYIIYQLFALNRRQGLPTRTLADKLYVSAPTLNKLLRSVQTYFEPWNIMVLNDRRSGYLLQYEENDFRSALATFFLENIKDQDREKVLNRYFYGIDLSGLKHMIVRLEHEWHLHFSNQVFTQMLIFLALAISRKDTPVHIRQEDVKLLEHYNEYLFAKAIFSEIERIENISLAEDDIFYLTMQMICAGFVRIGDPAEPIHSYDENLTQFVDEVMLSMGTILDHDFSRDQQLRQSMIVHLRSTVFRLRHGQSRSNELLGYIKQEFSQVYAASWMISMLFEKYFDLMITDDELGYIVLLIQTALERKDVKYRAVLIADFSKSYGELIRQRIMNYVPEIQEVRILSRFEKDNPHYRQADVILSRTSVNDPRNIVVENLLTEEGILKLRQKMQKNSRPANKPARIFSLDCSTLFSPDLMILQAEYCDKETLIRDVVALLQKKGFCAEGLCRSALEREKKMSTSIGSGIAFPHGDPEFVNESRVVLVTLKRPMVWEDHEKADLIFFAAFNMNVKDERHRVETFYRELIPCISNPQALEGLRQATDSVRLYQELFQ